MTEVTVKTTLQEFDAPLLEKLKNLFNSDAFVRITISNIPDETDVLLSTQKNRESLYRSLEQFRAGEFVRKSEKELAL